MASVVEQVPKQAAKARSESESSVNFTYINMREEYDQVLLDRFYDEVMKPHFPIEAELEPVEVWHHKLNPKSSRDRQKEGDCLFVLVAADYETESLNDHEMNSGENKGGDNKGGNNNENQLVMRKAGEPSPIMAGGLVFQYFKAGNCSVITYLVVDPRYRRMGLVRKLIVEAQVVLNEMAMKHAGRACDLLVLEVNATGVEDGIMPSRVRHKIMQRLGFSHVNFEYTQTPLAPGMDPVYDLLLLCHELSPAIEIVDGKKCVQAKYVKAFLNEYAHASIGYHEPKSAYQNSIFFRHQMKQFDLFPKYIELNSSLPWAFNHPPPHGALKLAPAHPPTGPPSPASSAASSPVSSPGPSSPSSSAGSSPALSPSPYSPPTPYSSFSSPVSSDFSPRPSPSLQLSELTVQKPAMDLLTLG